MPLYFNGSGLPKDVSKYPAGVREIKKIVANEAARFLLTTDDVQNGDTVKQLTPRKEFVVVDETKLNEEAGYDVTELSWEDVSDKPSTFTPEAHTHSEYTEKEDILEIDSGTIETPASVKALFHCESVAAVDDLGNAITNNVASFTTTAGKFGNAIQSSVYTETVLTTPVGTLAGDFTIAFWHKTNTTATTDILYLLTGISEYLSIRNNYSLAPGKTILMKTTAIYANNNVDIITSTEFTHYALVRNGSTTTLYINGEARITTEIFSGMDFPNGILLFGSGANTYQAYDEIIVCSEALYTGNFTPPSLPYGDGEISYKEQAKDSARLGGELPSYFEPAVTKGNLSETTSSVLTVTGGTTAVIGSGTTIEVKKASATQDGYLDSEDFVAFNAKALALPEGAVALYDQDVSEPINDIKPLGITKNSKLALPEYNAAVILVNKNGETYYGYDFGDGCGIEIDVDSSNPAVTRIGKAVGLTAGTDFNNVYPFSHIRRVALKVTDGVPEVMGIHAADDTDKWADGTDVDWSAYETAGWDCMVQYPRFYHRQELFSNKIRRSVFRTPIGNGKTFPAFTYRGQEEQYTYIAAFEGWYDGTRIRSLPGKQPTTAWNGSTTDPTRTFTWFKEKCELGGLKMMNVTHVGLLQYLFLIEYANRHSQSVLSNGITNLAQGTGNHSQNTGYTKSLGNYSGQIGKTAPLDNSATFATGSTTYPFSYRGVENFYGNIWKWVDGVLKRPTGLADGYTINGTHNAMTTVGEASGAYFKTVHTEEALDFLFMPNDTSNNSSETYYADGLYSDTSNDIVPLFGSSWFHGARAGVFYWYLINTTSNAGHTAGARVAF